jgi:hypothetical protein
MDYVKIIKLLDANKAKAAFLAPLLVAVLTAFGNFVVTGDFDVEEIKLAGSGIVLGLAATVGVYFTKTKTAIAVVTGPVEHVDPGLPEG